MAKKKLSKEEIKGPDSFITFSDSLVKMVENNKASLVGGAGLLLLVGLVILGISQYQEHVENSAAEALYAYEAQLQKKQAELDERLEKLTEAAAKKKDPKDKTPAEPPKVDKEAEFKNDISPILTGYKAAIAQHKETTAAALRAIEVADLYRDYEAHADAGEVLATVSGNVEKGTVLYGLVHSQLGTALGEQGKCQEALPHFENVVADKAYEYLYPDAYLKMGLCHQNLSQLDQAKSMFEKISTEYSDTAAATTAKNYLKLLALQSKGQ